LPLDWFFPETRFDPPDPPQQPVDTSMQAVLGVMNSPCTVTTDALYNQYWDELNNGLDEEVRYQLGKVNLTPASWNTGMMQTKFGLGLASAYGASRILKEKTLYSWSVNKAWSNIKYFAKKGPKPGLSTGFGGALKVNGAAFLASNVAFPAGLSVGTRMRALSTPCWE